MEPMMLDDLIVLLLLLVFVGVVTGIRLKARAQRAETVTPPARSRRRQTSRGRQELEAAS
jgi:hypothetical protein